MLRTCSRLWSSQIRDKLFEYIKGLDTLGGFSIPFHKGDDFHDFLLSVHQYSSEMGAFFFLSE